MMLYTSMTRKMNESAFHGLGLQYSRKKKRANEFQLQIWRIILLKCRNKSTITSQRQHSWQLLRRLKGLSSLPWLYAGELNELPSLDEKLGRNYRGSSQIQAFREALDDAGLKNYWLCE